MHCRCSTWNILLDRRIGDLCRHDPIVRCHRGRGRPRRERSGRSRSQLGGLHPAHHHEHGGHWPNVMQPRHGRHRQRSNRTRGGRARRLLRLGVRPQRHPVPHAQQVQGTCHVEPTNPKRPQPLRPDMAGDVGGHAQPRLLARRCGGTLDRTGPLRRGQDTTRHGGPRQGRGPHQRHLPQRLDAHRGETIRRWARR